MKRIIVLLLVVMTLVSIGLTLYSFGLPQDTRSRAGEEKPFVLPTSSVPRIVPDTPPYVRIETDKPFYKTGETGKASIFIHSDGQEVAEARIVLVFDPQALAISPIGVMSSDVFPTLSVDETKTGQVAFSLFVTPDAGYTPIVLPQEKQVATVAFSVTGSSQTTALSIARESNTLTGLFGPRDLSQENPGINNILNQVQGAMITIQ